MCHRLGISSIEGAGAEGGEVKGDETITEGTEGGEDGLATVEDKGKVGGGDLDASEVAVVAEAKVANRWEKRAKAILCGLDTAEAGLGERCAVGETCGEAGGGRAVGRGQVKFAGKGTDGGFGQTEFDERRTDAKLIECAKTGTVGGAAVIGIGAVNQEGKALRDLTESGHYEAFTGIATVGRVGGDGRFCKRVGLDFPPRYTKTFSQHAGFIDFGAPLKRRTQGESDTREVTFMAKCGQRGEEHGAVDTTGVGEGDTARGMGAKPIQ